MDGSDKDEATNFITRTEMLGLTSEAVSSLVCLLVYLLRSSGCGKKLFVRTAQDALWKLAGLDKAKCN